MPEEIAATPGWVEERLDEICAGLPPDTKAGRAAYLECLAASKSPSSPSDLLGAEFQECRRALRRSLMAAHMDQAGIAALEPLLEALEAEVAAQS